MEEAPMLDDNQHKIAPGTTREGRETDLDSFLEREVVAA